MTQNLTANYLGGVISVFEVHNLTKSFEYIVHRKAAMGADQFYSKISVDVERNEEIVEKAKELDARFQEPRVEIDSHWTSYIIKVVQSFPADRLIVFRPQQSSKLLGCIRVYKAGTTTKLWDVFDTDGIFIGKVPKDCAFEAMLVQVKMLTLTNHES